MLKFWFSFLFVCSLSLFAQNSIYTSRLLSSGAVPEDFVKLSSAKYKDEYTEQKDEKLDKEFYINTRFYIDRLLLSGKVVFNDPISKYVDKIAKYILKDNEELYQQLRFYTIKSTQVNAFSTDQGIVFVTSGLMAQLENEAQLAFILGHEIAHFTEKHVKNDYIKRQEITKTVGRYETENFDKTINELSIYKKENELVADKKGIDFFLRTDYNKDEILTSFSMLLYSYLPFSDLQINENFLNTPILNIPDSLFVTELTEIAASFDYDDAGHSHPNMQTRIEAAENLLNGKKGGSKNFIISEEEFLTNRFLARIESLNLNLELMNYDKALYQVFLLEKKEINEYTELAKLKAIYGMMKFKNIDKYNEVVARKKNVEGEQSRLNYFLNNLTREQLNVIALRYGYDFHKKYKGNQLFKTYYKDIQKEFIQNVDLDDLKKEAFNAKTENKAEPIEKDLFNINDSIKVIEDSDLSKYEKIKLIKKIKNSRYIEANDNYNAKYHLYALTDLTNNEEWIREMKVLKEAVELEKAADKNKKSKKKIRIERKERESKNKDILKKTIIVNPQYSNFGNKFKYRFEKSESKQVKLGDLYKEEYKKINLNTVLLDTKHLDSSKVETMNELNIINSWLKELLVYENSNFIPSNSSKMKEISNKYGTTSYLFSGVFSFKRRHEIGESLTSLVLISSVYLAPLALFDIIFNHHYFEFVAFEINAETNKIEFIQLNDVNSRDYNNVIRQYVYETLYQSNLYP